MPTSLVEANAATPTNALVQAREQGWLPEEAYAIWQSFFGNRPLEAPFAAVYPRVSSDKQEDGYSLGSQLKAQLAFAIENGYSVRPEHVFWEVHTGEELWERPALTRSSKGLFRLHLLRSGSVRAEGVLRRVGH